MKKRTVELSLNECESLLLLYRGREHQQLGFADSARAKITKARNEMIGKTESDTPPNRIKIDGENLISGIAEKKR